MNCLNLMDNTLHLRGSAFKRLSLLHDYRAQLRSYVAIIFVDFNCRILSRSWFSVNLLHLSSSVHGRYVGSTCQVGGVKPSLRCAVSLDGGTVDYCHLIMIIKQLTKQHKINYNHAHI